MELECRQIIVPPELQSIHRSIQGLTKHIFPELFTACIHNFLGVQKAKFSPDFILPLLMNGSYSGDWGIFYWCTLYIF